MNKQISSKPAGKFVASLPTSVASKAFDNIKASPNADWTISDIQTACDQLEMRFTAPKRGSHYKVSTPHHDDILTIPYNRPIKRVYVRRFIILGNAHIKGNCNLEKSGG